MNRNKDCEWNTGDPATFDGAQLAVLMDIRDELKSLNRVFHCVNFLNIPHKLDRIRINTTKPRRRRRKPPTL